MEIPPSGFGCFPAGQTMKSRFFDTVGNLGPVRNAALSRAPVSLGHRRTASPHEFYRYPARFSPGLASAVIDAFSEPGDLVADYFLGGGTTLVEARLAGRLGFGSDLNSLAIFVSKVKTRLYSELNLQAAQTWAHRATDAAGKSVAWPTDHELSSYIRNFTDPMFDEQRAVLFTALAALDHVPRGSARDFARCVLLRTAQWGMDMRSQIPGPDELRNAIVENAQAMIIAARAATRNYRQADRISPANSLKRSTILHQALPGLADHGVVAEYPAPRLIFTSPPYPGVYVNYHRWKLRGRLETPLPYFISGQNDGHGLAYYTMSARSDRSQETYFARLGSAYADMARLCDRNTWLVQVVGFSDVDSHLSRYLLTMSRAGFTEVAFSQLATGDDGRLWRDVPGRRWWARAGDRSDIVQHTSREVVLFHKLTGR